MNFPIELITIGVFSALISSASAVCNQCGTSSGVMCISFNTFQFCSNGNAIKYINSFQSKRMSFFGFYCFFGFLRDIKEQQAGQRFRVHQILHVVTWQKFVQVQRFHLIVRHNAERAAQMDVLHAWIQPHMLYALVPQHQTHRSHRHARRDYFVI